MTIDIPTCAARYLAASLLFILSLRGLSTQETRAARQPASASMGMAARRRRHRALALLIAGRGDRGGRRRGSRRTRARRCWPAALGIGGASIGALLAARVAMTSMPELVAILHSFVGAAAVLVGIATYLQPAAPTRPTGPRTWSRSTSACSSAR